MIRAVAEESDDFIYITTTQFLQGVKKGSVIGFHLEDYGPLQYKEVPTGVYKFSIGAVEFRIDLRDGDFYWMEGGRFDRGPRKSYYNIKSLNQRPKTLDEIAEELDDV